MRFSSASATAYICASSAWTVFFRNRMAKPNARCWQHSVLTFSVHILNLRNYCHREFMTFTFQRKGASESESRFWNLEMLGTWWKSALLQMDLLMDGYIPPNALLDVEKVILEIWQKLKNGVWACFWERSMLLSQWNRPISFHTWISFLIILVPTIATIRFYHNFSIWIRTGIRKKPLSALSRQSPNFWSRIRVSYIPRQVLKALRRQ